MQTASSQARVDTAGEGSPQGCPESNRSALTSAIVSLTLGILGSSILPVPYAISRTGLFPGLAVMCFVSLFNSYTGTLLLRMAGYLKRDTYESVCEAASGGSRVWRKVAQFSLISLLWGTLAGDSALLADTGVLAVKDFFKESAVPAWLENNQGRAEMVILITFVVLPLSLTRSLRGLEKAATAGLALVVVLMVVVAKSAIAAGFPALRNGELPLFGVAVKKDLPEATAVLSFAFYLQPMLLPLLSEMPAGKTGVDLTCQAVQAVTMVVATLVYGSIGLLAAARWGLETEGDLLVNPWFSSPKSDAILDALTAVYLSISMVPMAVTLRYQLDSLVNGGRAAPYLRQREVAFTILILSTSSAVALVWPEAAETIFSVTGATAVCMVCYVLPVAAHFNVLFRQLGQLEAPLLPEQEGEGETEQQQYPSYRDISKLQGKEWSIQVFKHIAGPLLVMLVGTGFCLSALALTLSKLYSR